MTINKDFTFTIKHSRFDENYNPSENTRITTNFANLARGDNRQQNLRNTLVMIDNRFNALAHWDNPKADRYAVELDIISVEMNIDSEADRFTFPAIEILKTNILDKKTHERVEGIVGNNFSSYVRDYDFSVLLPDHNKQQDAFSIPHDFGALHGNIFKHFVNSPGNEHPVLGIEYQQQGSSLTEAYFKKMGLQVRYFMPPHSAAPLAFYFTGDLLSDYTFIELIGTISTMETFQKIYRPEIYNANSVAGQYYQPSLTNQDH